MARVGYPVSQKCGHRAFVDNKTDILCQTYELLMKNKGKPEKKRYFLRLV